MNFIFRIHVGNELYFVHACTVMGSLEHSVVSLFLNGSLRADGETFGRDVGGQGGGQMLNVGPGGGSGGTILLFVQTVSLSESSVISAVGGQGSSNGGGGGGGGRVHFHWSDIPVGDAYQPIASVRGNIYTGFVPILLSPSTLLFFVYDFNFVEQ